MAAGSYLSIITLKVNGLNAPTKRQRLAEWIQKQGHAAPDWCFYHSRCRTWPPCILPGWWKSRSETATFFRDPAGRLIPSLTGPLSPCRSYRSPPSRPRRCWDTPARSHYWPSLSICMCPLVWGGSLVDSIYRGPVFVSFHPVFVFWLGIQPIYI